MDLGFHRFHFRDLTLVDVLSAVIKIEISSSY